MLALGVMQGLYRITLTERVPEIRAKALKPFLVYIYIYRKRLLHVCAFPPKTVLLPRNNDPRGSSLVECTCDMVGPCCAMTPVWIYACRPRSARLRVCRAAWGPAIWVSGLGFAINAISGKP